MAEHNNQPTIVKVSGHVRMQRARELAGVREDGGVGRGGMKPIPLTKPVRRHDNNDNNNKNDNRPMMEAVRGWGRMWWATEGWASEGR